ncbi:hypothetical protein VOLCADRAFT_89914, partial [Volvox carteri f. nagariensis]
MDSKNKGLRRDLAKFFGSVRNSDCTIIFCRDENAPKRPRRELSYESTAAGPSEELAEEIFGNPIPAHCMVLRLASERFAAKLEQWREGTTVPSVSSDSPAQDSVPSPPADARPQLRIPLASPDEVPSARAAIRFAYTGEVAADSIRKVLEVRRQANNLQMSGCVTACDEMLLRKLSASAGLSQYAAPTVADDVKIAQLNAAVDLLHCQVLWPDLGQTPSFAQVVNTAKSLLVSHFCDAVLTLNTASLRKQMLALPAVAVEALLSSDDFGTDCESTILLLLATWMRCNYDKTDDESRRRLCRTVRLAYLSRPYHSLILPALAADYERLAPSLAAWFPITVLEAAFVTNFASVPFVERRYMLSEAAQGRSSWVLESLRAVPRRQYLPAGLLGLTCTWHIQMQRLQDAMGPLQVAGRAQSIPATFDWVKQDMLTWQGLEWRVGIVRKCGAPTSGLYLFCNLPSAFEVPGSQLCEINNLLPTYVPVSARIRMQGVVPELPIDKLPSPLATHHARGPVQPIQQSSPPPLPVACSRDWPQLLIPLGGPDEVPSARVAIQFAYTGQVAADSIREVLEIRRQGGYLQIYGCVEACDRVVRTQLMAGATGDSGELYGLSGAGVGGDGRGGVDANGQASQNFSNGSSSSSRVQQESAALELFACEALWPDLDAEPAFAALVEAAKPLFIAHFGDTLKALNSPPLKQQLLELPPAALGVLLSSDSFGTDSESSVLLLLGMWMRVNCEKIDAQIRERLCRTVRLAHLSRPYLTLVLPALAADYEKDPDAPAGWFPIDPMVAAFVVGFIHAPLPERRKLMEANAPGPAFSSSHWLRPEPRPLCIPDEGLVFHWHIPQQELLAQLQQLQAQPGTARRCYATFECGELSVAAWGLYWRVSLAITGGTPAAGLFVWCGLPLAMCAPGSRLALKDGPRVLTQFVARLVVHRRHPGLSNVEVGFGPEDLLETDVKQTPPLLRLQSAQHMGARSKTESPASCGQQQGALSAHSGLPTFFIPLGSQAEVPSARDAVRFAYTDVEAEPSFATVLNTAKPMLVSHFSDALKTLNTIPLKQQLLALPAVAVEALLSSDDFGTDCESTILLLLATWMEANYDKTDAESRRRLCRTVRLAFLSPPYLSLVLPALAADHEKSQDGPAGWFPVDVMQAAFIAKLTDLPEWERKELVFLSDLPAHIFVALSLSRRRMCVPTTGLVFPWHVPEQELLLLRSDAGALSPSCARATTACTFAGNVSSFMGYGFSWRLCIPLVGEDMNAALSLHCELPAALAIPGSRLSRPCGLWTHVPVTAVALYHGYLVWEVWFGGAGRSVQTNVLRAE